MERHLSVRQESSGGVRSQGPSTEAVLQHYIQISFIHSYSALFHKGFKGQQFELMFVSNKELMEAFKLENPCSTNCLVLKTNTAGSSMDDG